MIVWLQRRNVLKVRIEKCALVQPATDITKIKDAGSIIQIEIREKFADCFIKIRQGYGFSTMKTLQLRMFTHKEKSSRKIL
jgi:hypothetical protein